jgi:hypothetical protein
MGPKILVGTLLHLIQLPTMVVGMVQMVMGSTLPHHILLLTTMVDTVQMVVVDTLPPQLRAHLYLHLVAVRKYQTQLMSAAAGLTMGGTSHPLAISAAASKVSSWQI